MIDKDDDIPSIFEPNGASTEFKKNCARLIQKTYEGDPLTYHKYQNQMKKVNVLENEKVIKMILKHLGLWEKKARLPPKATGPSKVPEYSIDSSLSQLPASDKWLYAEGHDFSVIDTEPVYT
jgi:hypothetical protein